MADIEAAVGKDKFDIRKFLEGQIGHRVDAFTSSGARIPVTQIQDYHPVLFQDRKSNQVYRVEIGSRGGMCYDDGDSQDITDYCSIERVSGEKVDARLHISQINSWKSGGDFDYVAGTNGHMSLTGNPDEFLSAVMEFAKAA